MAYTINAEQEGELQGLLERARISVSAMRLDKFDQLQASLEAVVELMKSKQISKDEVPKEVTRSPHATMPGLCHHGQVVPNACSAHDASSFPDSPSRAFLTLHVSDAHDDATSLIYL
eukprot:g51062.t1